MQPRLMDVEDPLEELLDGPLPLHTIQWHVSVMIGICHMGIDRDTPQLTEKLIYCYA